MSRKFIAQTSAGGTSQTDFEDASQGSGSMGGGRGIDLTEHLLSIIPEEAKLTPLVASSIVIGSSRVPS
ncbi:hypothetical protein [Candidatus Korarchaeum cryptofilum]|jgi:hypothetical protein|uniref:hypothetical protein n=1 Tax=Candidatus Korarchaeum cryptofilum TaxID=498846 RepID=UPI000F7848DD|nr:hypothetical protein [Candidatus Korarchaeum cryptofilum]